jgi:NAD+ kinase
MTLFLSHCRHIAVQLLADPSRHDSFAEISNLTAMPDISFQTIGLIGKYGDPGVADTLKALSKHLKARQRRVLLDAQSAERLPDHGLETADRSAIGARCDLAIIVGGDGTLLNAARSLAEHAVPLLGINLGRLGFLADVSRETMTQSLDAILGGDYRSEDRLMLQAHIERDGQRVGAADALNDVVIHKWEVARMIELETFIDGRYVNTHRSDGLIVATPTGSTAYALSGGGPILHPALETIELVPICPHTLSYRPIVVAASSEIEVVINDNTQAQVTCDGQINLRLMPGDRVFIRRKEHKLRLIHPSGHDYFEILRVKLGWGGQQKT